MNKSAGLPATESFATSSAGGIAASGMFELLQPTQVRIRSTGRCSLSQGSRISTMLQNRTNHQNLVVTGADIGAGTETSFRLECTSSLRLDPGLYAWVTEIVPASGGTIKSSDLNGDAVVIAERQFLTRGVHEAYAMMSGKAGLAVSAKSTINCLLKLGEVLKAVMAVTDLKTNETFSTPSITVEGPMDRPFGTGVIPYVMQAGRTYRAHLQISYAGSTPLTCLLTQEI